MLWSECGCTLSLLSGLYLSVLEVSNQDNGPQHLTGQAGCDGFCAGPSPSSVIQSLFRSQQLQHLPFRSHPVGLCGLTAVLPRGERAERGQSPKLPSRAGRGRVLPQQSLLPFLFTSEVKEIRSFTPVRLCHLSVHSHTLEQLVQHGADLVRSTSRLCVKF